jgi:hypothetical protein
MLRRPSDMPLTKLVGDRGDLRVFPSGCNGFEFAAIFQEINSNAHSSDKSLNGFHGEFSRVRKRPRGG